MDKIRWGVIGATGFADLRSIPEGIKPSRNGELTAVQSIAEDDLRRVAEKHGLQQWYADVGTMLAEAPIDACYIATPPYVHLEHVRACAEAGVHVFCEKPLAPHADEAEKMVAAANEHGVKFGTAFMMPFHHLTQEARRLVSEGAIGQVVSIRVQFGFTYPPQGGVFRHSKELHAGGAFMDVGCHATDLAERVVGSKVTSVMAMAGNVVYEYEGVEDSCLALYEFANGVFGCVDTYFACSPQNLVEMNGTDGVLIAEGIMGVTSGGTLRVRTRGAEGFEEKQRIESNEQSTYQLEFEAFADAVLNDTEPPVPGTDGLWNTKILDAVYESAETGQRISVS